MFVYMFEKKKEEFQPQLLELEIHEPPKEKENLKKRTNIEYDIWYYDEQDTLKDFDVE